MTSAHVDAPGLDLDRLAGWFAAAIPGAGKRLSASLIAGGKSNLTYVVSDGEHDWIVRRPPLGHVLATAHDMAREYRVMTALRRHRSACARDRIVSVTTPRSSGRRSM